MAWEVVTAALGATALTGIVSYIMNKQSLRATAYRAETEYKNRLAQLEREHQHQLRIEEIQRRTDLRRQRLLPLQELLGRLVVLSGKYQRAAEVVYMGEIGEPVPITAGEDFKKAAREIARFWEEELGPRPWWGVASPQLVQLLRKLTGDIKALENEAREYAEFFNAGPETSKRAETASANLDKTLGEIASLVEELVSGADLLDGLKDKG